MIQGKKKKQIVLIPIQKFFYDVRLISLFSYLPKLFTSF